MTNNPPTVEELKQDLETSSNLLTGHAPDKDWQHLPIKTE